MKVSLNWLKDYVALPPLEKISERLTAAGLEVEGIHKAGEGLAGVIVAQVMEAVPHPNADKLQVTQVDAGGGAKLQVVCGAKNFKVGDKVPLATVGTKLPNGTEIQRAQLRGVESLGMLCSAKELGTSEEGKGLLILDPKLKTGTPIAEALGMDDVVLELNVTPNRADALSHLGIARELSVLFETPLTLPRSGLKEGSESAADKVKVSIKDEERCPRYAARVIEGVKVGPSPAWLTERLKACGVRSINNVVDVTNYVLLEYGHPLHGFDLDKVAGGEVVVRLAKAGEKLTTLDGKERALDADDLVIADKKHPQAIAGVMGGGPSEVSDGTTRILLESAYFQPSSVRRSSKRHGLHTEASHRFERGTDVDAVPLALDRAAAMIAELGGGVVQKGRVDAYPTTLKPRTVTLRFPRVAEVLGAPVPQSESVKILTALGFKPKDELAGATTYWVPHARVDVEREEDLIEEVARVYGYDRIPLALPQGLSTLKPESTASEGERRVRSALAGLGFDEVVNYAFVGPKWLEALGAGEGAIALRNPISAEQSLMRTTLAASLLQNVAHNLRHQVDVVRLYELGRVYHPDPSGGVDAKPVAFERQRLAGVLAGSREGRGWTAKATDADFYDAKGAVEAVLAAAGVTQVRFEPFAAGAKNATYHPRASARVVAHDGPELGTLGELHPLVVKRLDLPGGVFLFDLDIEALWKAAALYPVYRQLTRFPAVLRDLAVVVPTELTTEQVQGVIREVGGALVQDVRVFDVYTGKPLPEGKKNLAYALTYRAADRTLTDEEVSGAHAKIVEEVNRRLGASLRGSNP